MGLTIKRNLEKIYLSIYKLFFITIILYLSLFFISSSLFSKDLDIYDLNLSTLDFKNMKIEDISSYLSQNFLIKDLICPPITGLNLESKKSHSIAIKSIQAKINPKTNKMIWTINLREDLFFSNSTTSIKADDMISFLEDNLKNIITEKTLSTVIIPNFSFNKVSDYRIEIVWETIPSFGPFVFNNVPIKNKKECAGFATIEKNIKLSSIDVKSKINTSRIIHFHYGENIKNININKIKNDTIIIKYPSNYKANPTTRFSDEKISCSTTLELPLFTVIIWNTRIKLVDDLNFRIAMISSIPRGELLRAAAGSLGSLVSFPILRSHPGYSLASSIRDFDLQKSQEYLNKLNYLQKTSSTWRKDKNNKDIELNIFDPNGNSSLEKILYDISLFMGIKINFIKNQRHFDINKYHGYLFTYFMDNDFNYMNYLHSKSESYSKEQNPFFIINNKNNVLNIDEDLEKYTLSLTREKPDFSLLKNIQDKMYAKELISSILQTNACIETNTKLKNKTINPYVLNQYLTNYLNNTSI